MDDRSFPKDFREWQHLEQGQREYLLWQALCEVRDSEKKFASKWTEKLLMGLIVLILTGFATGVISLVYAAK